MRTKNISYSFLKVYTKKKTELNYWKCIGKRKRLMKYSSCISVMRMVGLVFLEVARVSIRKLLMCVNLTKAVNRNDSISHNIFNMFWFARYRSPYCNDGIQQWQSPRGAVLRDCDVGYSYCNVYYIHLNTHNWFLYR